MLLQSTKESPEVSHTLNSTNLYARRYGCEASSCGCSSSSSSSNKVSGLLKRSPENFRSRVVLANTSLSGH